MKPNEKARSHHSIHKVRDYMTADPVTVESQLTVVEASNLMSEMGLRHLPVERNHHLVGIITDRDIARASGANSTHLPKVEELMTRDPYTVDPDADMEEILEIMASNRLGCVVVKGAGDKVVGIFTTTDAERALAQILHRKRTPAKLS